MTTLTVTVKNKRSNGVEGFEGIITLPGLKTTKLARQDGETFFTSRSALTTVARGLAKRLNLTVDYDQPIRKAAKRSLKRSSR